VIVLDTNVISELMRPRPRAEVVTFVRERKRGSLFTTEINRAALPDGRRRAALSAAADAMFAEDFAGRILPFGPEAAARYPEIVLARRRAGKPIEGFDALIAATALGAGACVATRDTGGFAGCGLVLLNPWTDA
jgi:predicted nucleic acid-binding protein